MHNKSMEIQKLILSYVTTVSVLLAVASLLITWKVHRAEHDWNRRLATANLYRSFEIEFRVKHGDALVEEFPALTQRNVNPPTEDKLLEIYQDPSSPIRAHIIAYLNYIEHVCMGCDQQVYVEEVAYEIFGAMFLRAHEVLKPFVDHANTQQGNLRGSQTTKRILEAWRKRLEKEANKNVI